MSYVVIYTGQKGLGVDFGQCLTQIYTLVSSVLHESCIHSCVYIYIIVIVF